MLLTASAKRPHKTPLHVPPETAHSPVIPIYLSSDIRIDPQNDIKIDPPPEGIKWKMEAAPPTLYQERGRAARAHDHTAYRLFGAWTPSKNST